MLRQIIIEEITFLEPLQGERRSIPIQFMETFEDVHMAIETACQGTAASRFIEQRQYQLDESTTDATVSEEDPLGCIDTYQVFEITITFSRLDISANVCPRCERSYDNSNQKSGNGWLRCQQCGAKFYTSTTMPTEAKTDKEEIEATQILEREDLRTSDEDKKYEIEEIDIDEQLWASDAKMAKLFRRIKFEADANLAISHGHDSSSSPQIVKNAQTLPHASSPDIDPQIIEALKSKDRIHVLKLGERMESLIKEKRPLIDLAPTTSYQRMLVLQCSAYYKLVPETDPATKNIFVRRTPDSRIPEHRMGELVPPKSSYHGSFRIPHFIYSFSPSLGRGYGAEVFCMDMPDLDWTGISGFPYQNIRQRIVCIGSA
ncbi:hypothetical protein BKA70DRAFT_1301142 [Coprinopsis sp. MPI-PUGE-AT-0042]|nr:hypothetical protein BKA70DRAFT_1301142 [Coprinopsis sp. MPI-PUGE-AT-0042]